LRSSGWRSRRQGRVLRFLPEREGASRGLFAGWRDRDFADAPVLAFVDLNEPVANETTKVTRQRGPLKSLEFREARGRNGAGLNQRRQKRELGAPNAGAPHGLFEGAGQIPAPAPRSGAHALPGGEKVYFSRFHFQCIYTLFANVKVLAIGVGPVPISRSFRGYEQ
jgi:hypothetical protein